MDPDLHEEPQDELTGAWDKDTQGEPKALTEQERGSTKNPWKLLS